MQKLSTIYLLFMPLIFFVGCTNPEEFSVTEMESPAANGSELPSLYTDNNGNVFLSWVEPDSSNDEYKLWFSKLNGGQWSKPEEIASSNSWFINWADYPSLVAYSGKAVAAHQLKKIPGNSYSYNINITLRNKDNTWSEPITPHFDSTATEHGFVSMVPIDAANIMAIWLDGRRTDDRTDEEYFNLNKAMTLRSAIIESTGSVVNSGLIDDSVCDCCQTSVAMTPKGPVAAYRNRTDGEIRDIYITRYQNDSWSEPVPVHEDNWKIGACPVNGPKITAKGAVVMVAWYTAAGGNPAVKAAVSTDFGNTFGKPFVINDKGTVGRVDVAVADSRTAYVSEISKSEDKYYLTVHKLSMAERNSTSVKVAEMNGSRRSGFPQMELANDKLIFAWTDADVTGDHSTRVKTAVVPLPSR